MSPTAYRCGSAVRISPSVTTMPFSTTARVVSSPTSSTLAARPVATSICSARSSVGSDPSGPTISATPSSSALTEAGSKRALVMTLMPRFLKARSISLETSASSSGTMAGKYSSTVTSAPMSR